MCIRDSRFVAARADWVQQARERAVRRAAKEARPLPDKETALAYCTAMSDKVYPAFAGVLGLSLIHILSSIQPLSMLYSQDTIPFMSNTS